MCDELKTHTDGHLGLCKSHAYQVKQAGGLVALEREPEPKTCEWVDPVEEPEATDPVGEPEETERTEA